MPQQRLTINLHCELIFHRIFLCWRNFGSHISDGCQNLFRSFCSLIRKRKMVKKSWNLILLCEISIKITIFKSVESRNLVYLDLVSFNSCFSILMPYFMTALNPLSFSLFFSRFSFHFFKSSWLYCCKIFLKQSLKINCISQWEKLALSTISLEVSKSWKKGKKSLNWQKNFWQTSYLLVVHIKHYSNVVKFLDKTPLLGGN